MGFILMARKILIVGGVAGGATAAARLRRLDELPPDTTINVYCGVGVRSYIACRILMQNGFVAKNISGGFVTYRSHQNKELPESQTARQLREEFVHGSNKSDFG